MMKVAFKTLGCKLNFSESSTISREFTKNGYEKVDFDKKSDIYIINTCSVTQNADKEFKYLVNKTKKNNPNAYVVAIGCYAQLKPKEISSIDGVDLVLGADKKFDILNYLEFDKKISQNYHSCEISNVDKFKPSYSFGDRSRSFLKIQDGCDYQCSYCTIPLARGKSRSPSVNSVIDSIKVLIDKGVQEVVLTGVNIGDFGINENVKSRKKNFFDLLNQISKINDLKRLRISSIEPNLLNNDIIDLVSECEKILPHFHIPLQSGSDKILRLMKRRYMRNVYEKRFDYIKSMCNDKDTINQMTLKDWKKDGQYIIVIPPSELTANWYDMQVEPWIENITSELKKHTDRPIKVRYKFANRIHGRRNATPLSVELQNCFAMVSWHSMAACEALIAGVPSFTSEHSPANRVSYLSLIHI